MHTATAECYGDEDHWQREKKETSERQTISQRKQSKNRHLPWQRDRFHKSRSECFSRGKRTCVQMP